MTDVLSIALLALVSLQVKHLICDGPLQTLRMVQDKSFYGRPQGVLHAAIHLVGTAIVFMLFGMPLKIVALLALVDGAIHYHIDFIKNNLVRAKGWGTEDSPYWWAFTADQMLHHMTYVLLVWLAFRP
jgi:hypothetical protein